MSHGYVRQMNQWIVTFFLSGVPDSKINAHEYIVECDLLTRENISNRMFFRFCFITRSGGVYSSQLIPATINSWTLIRHLRLFFQLSADKALCVS